MRFLKFLVLIALGFLIIGCSDQVQLQEGYEVVRLDYENRSIVDSSGEMIVYPDIRSCRVLGNLVIGKREENSQYPILLPENIPNEHSTGHFVLNLSNGKLRTGLTEEQAVTMVEGGKPGSNCMPRAFWTMISFGLFK